MRKHNRTSAVLLPTNSPTRGRWVHYRLRTLYPGPAAHNPFDPLTQMGCVRMVGPLSPWHAAWLKAAIRRRLGFKALNVRRAA